MPETKRFDVCAILKANPQVSPEDLGKSLSLFEELKKIGLVATEYRIATPEDDANAIRIVESKSQRRMVQLS